MLRGARRLEQPIRRAGLHHPDLLVLRAGGDAVAIELELSIKSRSRLEDILLGYSRDPRITEVIYAVGSSRVGRVIADVASRFGLERLITLTEVPVGLGELSLARSGGKTDAAWSRD